MRDKTETFYARFGVFESFIWFGFFIWLARGSTQFFRSIAKFSSRDGSAKQNIKKFDLEKNVLITFKDIAGCENPKIEMKEFVEFLSDPTRFHGVGARLPKGALLGGPPGTGKTLMAKACAGESKVPFFYMSGSDFVEKYVGVGASRIRNLFEAARKEAPSIIFIDEIDAVGRQRSGRGGGERDSTLNQLLVEMDGFGTKENVVIFAASNRTDILDKALKRPGRFDRIIEFNLPSQEERRDIMIIHLKGLFTALPIDIIAKKMAPLTPGFSGADLKNLCNEAAIIAARNSKKSIELIDFERAIERVMGGLEKKIGMTVEEKKLIAIHEAGKAVASWFLKFAPSLLKMSIIPRSKSDLGFSQYLSGDKQLQTEGELRDLICYRLGGRCAEQLFFNEVTTSAQKDLQKCYEIAHNIVYNLGMTKSMYNVRLNYNQYGIKSYSDKTNELADTEVEAILTEEINRCKALIEEKKDLVEKLADALTSQDTLDILRLKEILGESKYEDDPAIQQAIKDVSVFYIDGRRP